MSEIPQIKPKRFNVRAVATAIFYFLIIATIALIWFVAWSAVDIWISTDDLTGSDWQDTESLSFEPECNVFGIELRGELSTYISPENYDQDGYPIVDQTASEDVVYYIEQAELDESVKAIVLEVDSYGGYPVAAEEIADALKSASKPTVAFIRGGGASAAYWAASGADVIFASKNSDVGSIGVTASYLDYSRQNQDLGIQYIAISSGKFKDAGDSDKPLTAEERQLIQRDVDILHENFVQAVAQNRGLEVEVVRSLADGSTVLGQAALEQGLIDQLGGLPAVKAYLAEKIGEAVEICW